MPGAEHIGDPVEPPCPECGGQCVYNGNYFCTECKWGLPVNRDGQHHPHQAWFEAALDSLWRYRASRGHKDPFDRNPYMKEARSENDPEERSSGVEE